MSKQYPHYPWLVSVEDMYNTTEDQFELQYDADHVVRCVYVGEKNIQAEIDSHFDECDINIIVNRLLQGENFGYTADMCGDVSHLPTDPISIQNAIKETNAKLSNVVDDENSPFYGLTGSQIASLTADEIKALLTAKTTTTTTKEIE